jgi:site-specific DNA recombinase
VAVYARVSSHRQEREETIEGQLQHAVAWLRLNGHTCPDGCVYADGSVPGTDPFHDRPEGARLLEDAAANRFEAVAVFRLDRFGRSVAVVYEGLDRLERLGVKFLSMTEPFDTGTAFGRILIGLLAIFAQWEREAIRDRCYEGKKRAAANGTWIGGREPFGYDLVDRRLTVNEANAAIVREIFDLYANGGWGLQRIAYRYTRDGLPSPSHARGEARGKSGRWWASTIHDILTNPLYKGQQTWGDVDCPNPVPAIVSTELWASAQRRAAGNQPYRTPGESRYLLSGLIRCGLCGGACTGTVWKNGRRCPPGMHYYVCRNKIEYRYKGDARCQGPWLHGDIDQVILADCREMLDDPRVLVEELSRQIGDDRSRVEQLRQRGFALNERKAALRQGRERLLRLVRENRVTDEEFDRQDDEIKAEFRALDEQVAALEARLAAVEDQRRHLEQGEEVLASLRAGELTDAEVIRCLVQQVTLAHGDDGKPRVLVRYYPRAKESVPYSLLR